MAVSSIEETEYHRRPSQASGLGGVGWGDSHGVFGKRFPGEKENVRQCIFMMKQPVLLLLKS
jgi:hypothetical protein